jgi:hypothetical protein
LNNQRIEYVMDSDALMQAHRTYYAFDICSGFWNVIENSHAQSLLVGIDKVLEEINRGEGTDDLKRWAKDKIPTTFWCTTQDSDVVAHYGQIANWVNENGYTQAAVAKFMKSADGWLIAYGSAKNKTVVTQEKADPKKGEVKIPTVCQAFGIPCIDSFNLLRTFGVILKI